MRRIGTLSDESEAQRFSDYLLTLSIDATLDHDEAEGIWGLWIRDEQDVEKAKQEFAEFQQSPDGSKYRVEGEVSRIREDRVDKEQQRLKQHREMMRSMPRERASLDRPGAGPLAGAQVKQQSTPVTIVIIVVAVIVSFTSHFGKPRPRADGTVSLEQRTYYGLSFVDRREYAKDGDPYASVGKGELWRLVTPMLLHGDEFHLAFNMLWLFFLGSAIERLHGSLFLLLLTLGTQIAGMMLQVSLPAADFLPEALHGSPFAIGASGAVYGLFGFLWVRPAVDPQYPIHLVPMNVVLMMGWLVVCLTPLVSNVANGAHLGGLMAGIFAALAGYAFKR